MMMIGNCFFPLESQYSKNEEDVKKISKDFKVFYFFNKIENQRKVKRTRTRNKNKGSKQEQGRTRKNKQGTNKGSHLD